MALSDKLYMLRKKSGLSQEQLEEQLIVSRQAISKWESGQSVPESEKLIAISNYFDVSLDYLLKDENENESNDNAPETGTIQNTSDRTNWFLGVIICVGGIVCLILWGLLSIFNPTASNQLSESSMIQIDGNGIFLILCIVAIVVGAYLLLKNTTKKWYEEVIAWKNYQPSSLYLPFCYLMLCVQSLHIITALWNGEASMKRGVRRQVRHYSWLFLMPLVLLSVSFWQSYSKESI